MMKNFYKKNVLLPSQGGFSLIEMMISIPLGLLVMLAVMEVFTTNLQSVYLQNAYSRVQENGRMATGLIIRDIRGADYWGCAGGSITNHLDTDDDDYDEALLPIGDAIAGEDNVDSSVRGTIGGIEVEDGSDILTLRSANSMAGMRVTQEMVSNSAVIKVTAGIEVETGQIVLVSDCEFSDMFTNTTGNTYDSGNIGHNTGNVTVDGAINNDSQTLSTVYSTNAQILTPVAKIYFIGINPSGSESLYRSDNGVANELVRGVKNLQLIYGEDTSSNGSADTFSSASGVTNMDNVRSIRVSLTAESGDSSSGTPLEKDYEFTANIRNRTLQ